MITYVETDVVTLTMDFDDFARLLMALGMATGTAKSRENQIFLLRLVNDLNRTNPSFTPYEIDEHRCG